MDNNIIFILDFLAKNTYKFSEFFEIYDEEKKYYSIKALNPKLDEMKSIEKLFFEIRILNNNNDISYQKKCNEYSYRDLEFKNKKKKW